MRPEFWSDPVMGRLPYPCRLFYIGLWNVADDGGYMDWDPEGIGAVLLPYEAPAKRVRLIGDWAEQLVTARRLVILDCGCAVVPTLPKHQRITGKQSFAVRERHDRGHGKQSPLTDKQSLLSDSPGTLGNGRERNGTERNVGDGPFQVIDGRLTDTSKGRAA